MKVIAFANYVRHHIPNVDWLWIDTCCINQDSDRELSEAINSMFKWYMNAEVCLAYLADVESGSDMERFKESEWFERGWTLQELLAPRTVIFLNQDWEVIGHKGGTGRGRSGRKLQAGRSLEKHVREVTRIPGTVLADFRESSGMSIQERLDWAYGRQTMREEDLSYSLMGIFDVSMSIRYGEGLEKARQRLLSKIQKSFSIPALLDFAFARPAEETARGITPPPSSTKYHVRDPTFEEWMNDDTGDRVRDMQAEDPLGMQLWKLWHKHKSQLPNGDRLENLTWRLMSMRLLQLGELKRVVEAPSGEDMEWTLEGVLGERTHDMLS